MSLNDTWNQIVRVIEEKFGVGTTPRIQLALAVILVDLALVDNAFVEEEKSYITSKIRQYFNLSPEAALRLQAQAKDVVMACELQDLLAAGLRVDLPLEERQAINQFMEELVLADRVKVDLEQRLIERYRRLLGL